MEEQPKLTPEEYKKLRDERNEYYKENISFLETQKAYESLVTDLQELEMRRVYALKKIADITGPPPDKPKPS